jgi:hypothetical protein
MNIARLRLTLVWAGSQASRLTRRSNAATALSKFVTKCGYQVKETKLA